MKRIIFTGAALMAIVPAGMGLFSNASFSQSVPVRIPAQVAPLSNQSHLEPGDDKGGLTRHLEPGDDKGGLTRHLEPGDDKGGHGLDDNVKAVKDDGSGHK